MPLSNTMDDVQPGAKLLLPSLKAKRPSQSFRDMQICPSPDELLCTFGEVPLRANTGRYRNADDYLDVHFRLLREDFVRPLREAVAVVRDRSKEQLRTDEDPPEGGPKVYTDVCFTMLKQDVQALTILVWINPEQINFANEKLFMYGSLLCFSEAKDNFSGSVVLAKVSNCCLDLLHKGYVGVSLIDPAAILDVKFDASYVMFESRALFETYFHVMTALQSMELQRYPMCNYITGRVAKIKEIRCGSFANPGLNPTQFKAYRRALLNDLSLIQGPPGTGKTFLGLSVIRRMIEFDKGHESETGKRQPPILVLSGSNHALDQFLERVLDFCTNVIRVGGQSKSKLLAEYNMKLLRSQYRIEHTHRTLRWIDAMYAMNPVYCAIKTRVLLLNSGKLSPTKATETKKLILLLIDKLHQQINEYEQCCLSMDLGILRNTRVVGMTTTGANRLRPLLDKLRPRIVIVEEAAAVMEGQIVGALTRHCQQLVLIGDHQQLRPMASCHQIGKNYRLDISLFERLCTNGVPHVTLDVQHRMRPEFARLLVPSVYLKLDTDGSALNRPGVRGVEKNLFFLTHSKNEESTGCSKKNVHEAMFLVAFCVYLILQGNAPEEITVIAMYNAQVEEIVRLGANKALLKGVLVTSVDGYQGEENDIVLLSLVRSNSEAQIGFLSTVNRVCVALSRARRGLYIIGNMENLIRDKESVWRKIYEELIELDSVGPLFRLRCSEHGSRTQVSCASDFKLADGCGLGCVQIFENLLAQLTLSNKQHAQIRQRRDTLDPKECSLGD